MVNVKESRVNLVVAGVVVVIVVTAIVVVVVYSKDGASDGQAGAGGAGGGGTGVDQDLVNAVNNLLFNQAAIAGRLNTVDSSLGQFDTRFDAVEDGVQDVSSAAHSAGIAASSANTTATNANSAANVASLAASGAQSRADDAYSLGQNASSAATGANTAATNAHSAANVASLAASGAQSRADDAYGLAGGASLAASTAQTTANTANTTANTLQTARSQMLVKTYMKNSGSQDLNPGDALTWPDPNLIRGSNDDAKWYTPTNDGTQIILAPNRTFQLTFNLAVQFREDLTANPGTDWGSIIVVDGNGTAISGNDYDALFRYLYPHTYQSSFTVVYHTGSADNDRIFTAKNNNAAPLPLYVRQWSKVLIKELFTAP